MRAGNNMPPIAAKIGSVACLREDNSPTRTSRLISKPTTKKKIAIRPSLIQCIRSISNFLSPKLIANFSYQISCK